MKKLFFFLIFTFLFIAAKSSYSQEWYYICEHSGINNYVDIKNITRADDHTDFWVMAGKFNDGSVEYIKYKIRTYCQDYTYVLLLQSTFYLDGTVQKEDYPEGSDIKRIEQGSVVDMVSVFICQH